MRLALSQFLLLSSLGLFNTLGLASSLTIWQAIPENITVNSTSNQLAVAENARYLTADPKQLAARFAQVNQNKEMLIPTPTGELLRVRLKPDPILATDLAEKYPQMMTYQGQQIDAADNFGRFSFSQLGLFGFFRYQGQWMLLSPVSAQQPSTYISYWYKDAKKSKRSPRSEVLLKKTITEPTPIQKQLRPTGESVRTYRLAISTTGEYSQALGGVLADLVAGNMNLINRINQILLVDLAIQFEMVDNESLLFLDAETDPYTNQNDNADLSTVQQIIDDNIGNSNYDIGHLLSTNDGGLAFLGVVCNDPLKAQGTSGSSDPQGESFYIDLVAHELGHQLGALHTFNALDAGACVTGTRSNNNAYEPGSGSTIMAYAGICSPQDLQNVSDPYFHARSIEEIRDYVDNSTGGTCGTVTAINNNIPQIQLDNNSYTIPTNSPFVLDGSATDADDDLLLYNWEQYDNAGAGGATSNLTQLNADNGQNPLFRSFPSTEQSQRFFPKLSDLLNNQSTIGETYPTTDRQMTFRLTVRDNKGGVNQQDLSVSTVDTGQNFSLDTVQQNTWQGLSQQPLSWQVAGTDQAPISCLEVDLVMDLDGDGEFEHNLLTQTPNDGQQNIIAPNIASDRARIQMLCSNNIFYTVSTETIEILFTAPVAPIIEGQNVVTIDEDSSIVVTLSDLLIFDPDSAFPEDFSLLLQEAINFTVDGQTISPSANFNGDLRVPMQVNDGGLDSNQFSLLVQVTAINDPPIAVDDMQILTENSGTISINVLANDTDIDSEELFITALDYSGQGQLVINNQQIDYRPAASFVGNESFTYTVSDNELSAQAQVTLQVQGVNPVPTTNRSQNSGGGSIFTLLYLYFAVFSARLVCSKRWGSYE